MSTPQYDNIRQDILIPFSSICLVFFVVAAVFAFRRREIQPLKVRSFALTCISFICIILLFCAVIAEVNIGCDKDTDVLCNYIPFPLICFSFLFYVALVLRGFRLFAVFAWERIVRKTGINNGVEKFAIYKKAISNTTLTVIALVLFCIFAVVGVICIETQNTKIAEHFYDFAEYAQIFLAVCLIVFGLLMWKEPYDVFFLKQEFIGTAVVGAINWIVVVFINEVQGLGNDYSIIPDVVSTFHYLVLGIIVLVLPVVRTYKPPHPIFRLGRITGFKDILEQPELRKLYTAHLVKELSIENIMFYDSVEELKTENDDSKKRRSADFLMKEYIEVGSEYEINIDNQLRKRVTLDFQNNSYDAFVAAQKYIYRLLSEDSYPRFLKSPELKEWTRKIEGLKSNVDAV